jgi:hypothetical protein
MPTFFEQMISDRVDFRPDLESVEILPLPHKMAVESSVFILQSDRRLDFISRIRYQLIFGGINE